MGEKQKKISENIRFLSNEYNMNQSDFGKICNSTGASVSSWCTGMAVPSIDKIISICNHFDISIDDFVLKKLEVRKEFFTSPR